jgi:hypothetical protein
MKLQEKFKKKYKIDAIDFVEKANLKNFGLVKKVGLENVLEDYIKSENLSFKIDDEFNKDLIEAFAEAGERFPDNVKLSFRSNDNFNLEPTPINPSIPKSKGTLENFKDIVGNDELRVKMNGVYVSEDGYLVGTDAHKLIKFKSNEYNKYAGKIINLKTFIASKGKKLDFIDEKYPDYQAVIPRENEEIENLPTYNFYNLAKSTIAIKKLQDSDIFNINFKIKDKIYSFNPIIMLDVLNFALCNGLDTFTFKYSEPNRAALLDFGSKCVGLVMPVYNQNDLTKGTTLMTFEDVINNYRNFKPSTKEKPSAKVEVKKETIKDVPYTKFDGTIKDTTYIPRRDISYVVLKNGDELTNAEIADGVYKINKKMATGGGVGNEIAEIKAKIEKAKKNKIMPENLKKQYIEKYEKQLAGLILKQGTKEDVKEFLEVTKGKTPKVVKVEPKISKEQELAEKLMGIESDVLDSLEVNSNTEIKENYATQSEYVFALDKKINTNMFKGFKANEIRDILEDENYHTLNNYLGLKGYYGQSGKNDYKSYYDRNIKKGNKIFLNPSIVNKKVKPKKENNYKIGDIVYNNESKSIGIVRDIFDRNDLRTDADGVVDMDSLEIYNKLNPKHQKANIAPSTKKELGDRYMSIENKKTTKSVQPTEGRTPRAIAQDKQRPAKKAGKRISKNGNLYYESRENHSDKNQKTRLEKGGVSRGWKHKKK